MAKKRFLHILAPFLECKKGIFFKVVAKWGKCKKNHFFCRNGLYPCWYKIYQEAMRFWKLFGILVHPTKHCQIVVKSVLSQFHCSQVGPHLGTLVPMGTKMRFLVPIWSPFFFKVPIFSILGLRTRQKSVQPLSYVNHLITCDNKNWFQKLSTGPNGD